MFFILCDLTFLFLKICCEDQHPPAETGGVYYAAVVAFFEASSLKEVRFLCILQNNSKILIITKIQK